MKPQRLAHYCSQCLQVFYSTSPYPISCTRCHSEHWTELKKHHNNQLDLYMEDDD